MGYQRLIGRILVLTLVVGGLIVGVSYWRSHTRESERPLLRLFTWSNYYPEEILTEFTEKTGIEVELSYFSSNEELFAKFKAGATGYDIIQPSDYMVALMAKLDMLSPMDHAQLPEIKNLDGFYLDLPYDRGLQYSVPFTWGTSGIAVNTEKIKVDVEKGVSWKLLLDSPDPRHTSLLDDMREVFQAALYLERKQLHTASELDWEAAKNRLVKTKTDILMFTSEAKPLLLKEELHVAHIYSTDGIAAQLENPKIRYFIPNEGATIWTDNFALPKQSARKKEAHVFINYFLNPENSLKLAQLNHLATPNRVTRARLPASEAQNPHQYPPMRVMKQLQFLEDLGPKLLLLSRKWTDLKSS